MVTFTYCGISPDRFYRGETHCYRWAVGVGEINVDPLHNALEEHQKGELKVDGTVLSLMSRNIDKIRSELGMLLPAL